MLAKCTPLSSWPHGSKTGFALMSGIASIALLFWATIWPPSQDQLKHALFIVSAVCFIAGSYRIWARENQRVRELTEKTQIEVLTDLVNEFEALERHYAGDSRFSLRKLPRLIDKARAQVRRHAPEYIHRFNRAANDPDTRPDFIPTIGRTNAELERWLSNKKRLKAWKTASSCLEELRHIHRACLSTLPHYRI
jgi:hypothetical protein